MYKSQNNEAEIIINYFNGFVGNLLDIGANNGMDLSNSYDLIKLGWSAILVEPGTATFDRLQYLHKYNSNAYAYNFGIAEKTGKGTFFNASDSLLSTTKKELLTKWTTVTNERIEVDFKSFI